MIPLFYLAVTDDDLVEGASLVPLNQIRLAHVLPEVRQANSDIIELYRPDGTVCIKNTYHEPEEKRVRRTN